MTTKHFRVAAIIAVLLQVSAGGLASAASPGKSVEIGTKFPDRFPVIQNFYLGKPGDWLWLRLSAASTTSR